MDGVGRPSTTGGDTFSFNFLVSFVVYSFPTSIAARSSSLMRRRIVV